MPNLATSVITGSPSVAKSVFLRNYFRQGFSSFNDTNYLTILLKYRFWFRKYRQGWDFAFFLLFSVWGVKFKGILTLISYILRLFTGRSGIKQVSLNFPGWVYTDDPAASASQTAEITGVHHHDHQESTFLTNPRWCSCYSLRLIFWHGGLEPHKKLNVSGNNQSLDIYCVAIAANTLAQPL